MNAIAPALAARFLFVLALVAIVLQAFDFGLALIETELSNLSQKD